MEISRADVLISRFEVSDRGFISSSSSSTSSVLHFSSIRLGRPNTSAFSLIELMVVISVIAIALAFLVPALAPATGRSIEGAARQLTADLENARQLAIAERTKTRVLIPDRTALAGAFGAEVTDLALRGYTIVSFNRTAATWKQRGRWTRLTQPATFDPSAPVDPAKEEGVIQKRKTETTNVDNSASGTAATKAFTGAYIEFRANGSTSLDPASPLQVVAVADGIPDGNGNMQTKNPRLKYRITIDPLTGSARVQ